LVHPECAARRGLCPRAPALGGLRRRRARPLRRTALAFPLPDDARAWLRYERRDHHQPHPAQHSVTRRMRQLTPTPALPNTYDLLSKRLLLELHRGAHDAALRLPALLRAAVLVGTPRSCSVLVRES